MVVFNFGEKMKVQKGDKIQWTASGTDMFVEPKCVREVSECGQYCFVEGSQTGLPVNQTTVIESFKDTVENVIHSKFEESKSVPQTKNEIFTFFWHGPFSQWHKCRFVVSGVVYNCAEQYMMAGKARLFTDFNALEKIMKASDPSVQKQVGRNVRGFDETKWNKVAKEIVYNGNHAKFTQNATLLKQLLQTVGTMVEASPYDKIWGIGRSANDKNALRRETWNGKNWLGELLTKLREDLRAK